ncbi:hypothetical protein JTB14_017953 [Gonioctena quinquepunctata]|nr:hypothetical protein JTB14_017953 [Gonioctena quinquepunctata]
MNICFETIPKIANFESQFLNYCHDVDGVTILDVMDEAKMDFKNMMGELKFFGGAAAETSSKALWFVLTMLALHTDIQEKVFEEVSEVVGKCEVVDHVIVRNLKYTEMVISETLRLFPPVPLIIRKVTGDLKLGENVIPRETNIVLNVHRTHRNEKYWKDPLKFEPNRFLPEEVKNRHPFCYLPFSAGSRNCIAWKYALMSNITVIANIIKEI